MNTFVRLLARPLELALRYPRQMFLASILLISLSAIGLKFLRFQLDVYDVRDESFPSSVSLWAMREEYGDSNSILLAFQMKDRKAGPLCQLDRGIQTQVRNHPDIAEATSALHIRYPLNDEKTLWYPPLIPAPCDLDPETDMSSDFARLKETPFRHVFFNDANEMLYEISFRDQVSDQGEKSFRVQAIGELMKNLDGQVHLFGQGSFRHYFKEILAKDSFFNLLVLVLMIFFFRLFYGTWRAGFYLLFVHLVTLTILYGWIGWSGMPIDFLSNNLFLLTIIAGTGNFLFLTQSQFNKDLEQSFRSILAPGFFTTFTTFLGFISLAISDFAIIQRFGLTAGIGCLIERSTSFVILPAFLKSFGLFHPWVQPTRAWRPNWIRRLTSWEAPYGLCLAFIIFSSLGCLGLFHLNYKDEPLKNFPEQHALRKAAESFRKNYDWQGVVYLVFPPQTDRSKIDRVRKEILNFSELKAVEDPFEIQKFFSKDKPELLGQLIERDISSSSFFKKYFSSAGSTRIPLYLKTLSTADLESLNQKILAFCQNQCHLVGQSLVYLEYGQKISSTLLESFLLSIVLVLVVLLWLTHSLGQKNYLAIIVSSIIGPLFMISLMAVFQIPVSLVTSIFLGVIVGMTGDNAIQYLFAGRSIREGVEERGEASFIFSFFLCAGSLAFLFQTLIPMKILGGLFFLGFATTLFGDLWILKYFLSEQKCPHNQKPKMYPNFGE